MIYDSMYLYIFHTLLGLYLCTVLVSFQLWIWRDLGHGDQQRRKQVRRLKLETNVQ